MKLLHHNSFIGFVFLWALCQAQLLIAQPYTLHKTYDSASQIDFALMFPQQTNSAFFGVGETHNIQGNENIMFEALKYLHKNNNVRTLVLEAGMASSYLYQIFLATGDTSLICKDFLYHSTKERRTFWRKLFAFNQALPVGEKLKVIGLDFERSYAYTKAISLLVDDKKLELLSAESQYLLKQVMNYAAAYDQPQTANFDVFMSLRKALKEAIKKERALFKRVLGKQYAPFSLIVENDFFKERTSKTNQQWVDNLAHIYAKIHLSGNLFGQFGSAHLQQTRKSFSYILPRHLGLSVVTCQMIYLNSKRSFSMEDFSTQTINVHDSDSPFISKQPLPFLSAPISLLMHDKADDNTTIQSVLVLTNRDAASISLPACAD